MEKNIPQRDLKDSLHSVTANVLGQTPLVGPAISELFRCVIQEPYEKRFMEFFEDILQIIERLSAKSEAFSAENLSKNEVFLNTLYRTTYLVVRNHQEEKLEALRNVLLNAALSPDVDESMHHLYIQYIDELTVWHIKVLQLMSDPKGSLISSGKPCPGMGNIRTVIETAFPELKNQREFVTLVWNDLDRRELVLGDVQRIGIVISDPTSPSISKWGSRFLKMLSTPDLMNEDD